MITYAKQSKMDKVDSKFFVTVKISMEKENEDETTLPYLLPPGSLMIDVTNGDISKKKFNKKYSKYLKKNKGAEFAIFNILKALKSNTSICFTCTDDEYKLGYLKTLVEHISSTYGVEIYSLNEANSMIKDEISLLDKKHKKLIKLSDDEIESEKKLKVKKKILKNISKSIKSEFSEDGNSEYEILDRKFAVEQIIWSAVDNGICEYKGESVTNIDESKIKKVKPFVMAIMLTADNDKDYKTVIKDTLSVNSLKFKEKELKNLSKVQIVSLCGEIVKNITKFREGTI